ncbi:hypothetical protein K3M67_02865 [Sphingobium sp. V4]|uniref:hypothetical protein n=1 Tax=Sphingobium sp. V4 TaxID=3038927 RepID=UPI00255821B5|nr:hypothetical protein [Sphingobium sp. V4]WIW88937.1 hypothetical protein K3M67_02865 [Sphingobium sp. V4]
MVTPNAVWLRPSKEIRVSKGDGDPTWIEQQSLRIKGLSYDWDGYGAEPIDDEVVDRITGLLGQCLPKHSKRGSLVPGADGSVQAEWHLPKISIGLLIDADETISCWVHDNVSDTETEKFGWDAISLFKMIADFSLA